MTETSTGGRPRLRFPTLYFEATRRCNLRCAICMTSSNDTELVRRRRGRELSADEVERLVLEPAHDLGVRTIIWSGGEFLVRRDALELLRRARRHGYRSSVCSNGLQINEERLLAVREAAGEDVVLSVGINSLGDRNAQTRDAGAEVALRALELCARLGIRRHVVVNVGRHNMHDLGRTLQYLADHGIPFNRSPFTARGSGARHFAANRPSAAEMEKHIHPHLRRHAAAYVSYTPFFLAPERHERHSKGRRNVTVPQHPSVGCWIGTWVAVNAEGDVAPCAILLDELNAGNVRRTPLPDIVADSPIFRRILDRRRLRGKCGRCRYRFTCGGCRAMAWFCHGDYMAEDPTCFFDPVDETTVSPHEEETNRVFGTYAVMARFAGCGL